MVGMELIGLHQRLHVINSLEKAGKEAEAYEAVDKLNEDLDGSHLRCWWASDTREWILQDTLINDRETGA